MLVTICRIKKHLFWLLLLLISFHYSYSQENYIIEKPIIEGQNYSGDKQHEYLNRSLSKTIRFRVLKNDHTPASGFMVDISELSKPSGAKGFIIRDKTVLTDNNGIAKTEVMLGDKEGEYSIIATIKTTSNKRYIVYSFYAKSSKWLIMLLIGLIGGLGIFLYGMEIMSIGLQKSAGEKIRNILGTISKNKYLGFGAGAVFTMILQSSTAIAVMLMTFVKTKLLKYPSTIPILIGSAVGTTITAQLIAFKMTDYAIIFIGVGSALYLLKNKGNIKNIGEAILGFGLLFFGLKIMSESMYPLRTWDPFINILLTFENPIIGIGFGALFTALIHSSSACIGIIMVFSGQGLISLESGMYLVLGANLGTSATALIAGINSSQDARKVAYTELIYKTLMVFVFVWLVPYFTKLYNQYSYANIVVTNEAIYNIVPRQIANAHTIFNVFMALLIFPFIPIFEKFIYFLFPKEQEKPLYSIKYIDNTILTSPALALQLSKQETIRLAKKIYLLTDEIMIVFLNNDFNSLEHIDQKRDEVKAIRDEIKNYSLQICHYADEKRIKEVFQILHVVQELSQINDSITKIMHRRAEKWIDRHYSFSDKSKNEILECHKHTLQIFKNAIETFETYNLQKAKTLKKQKYDFEKMIKMMEQSHFERLISGDVKDIQSSKTQLEIIHILNNITLNSINIVKDVVYIE